MSYLNRNLGELVRKAREARGLSREALAFDAGIAVSTLERIERHDGHGARYATVVDVLAAMGLQMFVAEIPKPPVAIACDCLKCGGSGMGDTEPCGLCKGTGREAQS